MLAEFLAMWIFATNPWHAYVECPPMLYHRDNGGPWRWSAVAAVYAPDVALGGAFQYCLVEASAAPRRETPLDAGGVDTRLDDADGCKAESHKENAR